MKQRFWHIEGFDGVEKVYERTVKIGYFTENQLIAVLKSLTAKARKRGTKIANQHLQYKKDGDSSTYVCGDNPYFVARVI